MALYLTDADVAGLIDLRGAMAVIEEAFAAKALGEAVSRPRLRLPLPDGNYNVMAASWPDRGVVGHKSFTAGTAGLTLDVMLYDAAGGGLLAIIEGRHLTQLRTGAASGVASRHLAVRGGSIALIGTGVQATTQLEAVALATSASGATVFSRAPEHRASFIEAMSGRLGIPITSADRPRRASTVPRSSSRSPALPSPSFGARGSVRECTSSPSAATAGCGASWISTLSSGATRSSSTTSNRRSSNAATSSARWSSADCRGHPSPSWGTS
jgi:hypothetical protein